MEGQTVHVNRKVYRLHKKMFARDVKEKQYFWMTPAQRHQMKMEAARLNITLEAAYNEAIEQWLHPPIKEKEVSDMLRSDREMLVALSRMMRKPKTESDRLLILLLRNILERHYASE